MKKNPPNRNRSPKLKSQKENAKINNNIDKSNEGEISNFTFKYIIKFFEKNPKISFLYSSMSTVFTIVTGFISLWQHYYPVITIDAGNNIDPSRIYATTVHISNRGNLTIHDVGFSCGIGVGGGTTILNGTFKAPDLKPLSKLSPGKTETRSCDVGDVSVSGNNNIEFQVTYYWSWFNLQGKVSNIFSVKRGPPGYFLEPSSQ